MITILVLTFLCFLSKDYLDGFTGTDYIIMAIIAHSITNEIVAYLRR